MRHAHDFVASRLGAAGDARPPGGAEVIVEGETPDSAGMARRLEDVERRVAAACARAGRERSEVTIMLATKTVAPERIRAAVDLGYPLLGENKVQEALDKADAVGERVQWHLIGHLQTNKVKHALRFASCIQSLDRPRLAHKLAQRLAFENRSLDVMLQVNTSGEASKFGVAPEHALEFAREVAALARLRIVGLMTIGRLGGSPEVTHGCFQRLRAVRDQLTQAGIGATQPLALSMGMSGDFETAIEQGATLIRVGTTVFGERPLPDSYYWPG